jgi:arsenite-transporting ATPase
MRIILYTGKGGVGKTSIAAASALRAAQLGYKTIVLSTDAAHSLADCFDIPLGGEPTLVNSNLWGQETRMSQAVEEHWSTIQAWVATLLEWRGMDEIMADEMAILPGMEELANLLYIADYHDKGEYDVAIVDCAPTGETLRLLGFPEMLRWWVNRLFPLGRVAARTLRPIARHISDIPFPGNNVFDAAEHLFTEVNEIQALLTDPEKTSVRLVVNPERMVIKEAQRTFTYLNLYAYHTDLIICNRLFPQELKDSYFDHWKESQAQQLYIIKECFSPLPILNLPLFDQEIVGMPMLHIMGRALYKDDDPTKFFFHGQAQRIESEDGNYILSLDLPFITKSNIELLRDGEELTIQVGDVRRNIVLPNILKDLPVAGAKFADGKLKISFVKKEVY